MSASFFTDPYADEIPREDWGWARALRRTLLTEIPVVEAEINGIIKTINLRTLKGSIPRPETLAEAARKWQSDVSEIGRLEATVERKHKRLVMRDLRLTAGTTHFSGWGESSEPGFAVIMFGFSISRRDGRVDQALLAGVSMHAMARWHQRIWPNTVEDLKTDVRVLAAHCIDMTPDSEFEAPAPGGKWVGTVEETLDEGLPQTILGVRSFIV